MSHQEIPLAMLPTAAAVAESLAPHDSMAYRGHEDAAWIGSNTLAHLSGRTNHSALLPAIRSQRETSNLFGVPIVWLLAGTLATSTAGVATIAGLDAWLSPHTGYHKDANYLKVGYIKTAAVHMDCEAITEYGLNGAANTSVYVLGKHRIGETGNGVEFKREQSVAAIPMSAAQAANGDPGAPKAAAPPENDWGAIYNLGTCFKPADSSKWFDAGTPGPDGKLPIDPKTGKQIVTFSIADVTAWGGYDPYNTWVQETQGGHAVTQLASGVLGTIGGAGQLACAGVTAIFGGSKSCDKIDFNTWDEKNTAVLGRNLEVAGAEYIQRVCAPQNWTKVMAAIDASYDKTYGGKVEIQYVNKAGTVVDEDRAHPNAVPDYSSNQLDILRNTGTKFAAPGGYSFKAIFPKNAMSCGPADVPKNLATPNTASSNNTPAPAPSSSPAASSTDAILPKGNG